MEMFKAYAFKPTSPDGFQCCALKISGYDYTWDEGRFRILIVLNGRIDLSFRGNVHHLKNDDIVIVNPSETHAAFSTDPDAVIFCLSFARRAFREVLPQGMKCHFNFISDGSEDDTVCRQLRYLCAQMANAAASPSPTSDMIARGAFDLLKALLLTKFHPDISQRKTSVDIDTTTQKKIISELTRRYNEKITLEEVASKFGYNRTYLSGAFKKVIGVNLYEYLTMIRFRQALRELTETDKTLTSITYDCGFPEPKTFNRIFRNQFGILPAEYRSILKQNNISTCRSAYLPFDTPEVAVPLQEYISI